jgi:exopolysaccharide biosynthesis polyprenyl glycosylphosphotransferase
MRADRASRRPAEARARRRRGLILVALHAADVAVVTAALRAADQIRFHLFASSTIPHAPHADLWQPALLAAVVVVASAWAVGLYDLSRAWRARDIVLRAFLAAGLGIVGFLAVSYLVKEFSHSRLMLWAFAAGVWAGVLGVRLAVARILLACFRRGAGVLRVVVVGDSPAARALASRARKDPRHGIRIAGRLLAADGGGDGEGAGRLETVFAEVRRARPHVCLFAEPVHGRPEMTYLLARCQEEGIGIWVTTDLIQRFSPRMDLREAASTPVIVVGGLRLAAWERLLKRTLDVLLSALLLLLSAPFLIVAAVRIRREIGPPVLFRQTRVGFQGRPFDILKLRAVAGEAGAGRPEAGGRTRFCDFLREYSLDEIPQLWNVIRGEMSLVGPRPEPPERVRRYSAWNRRRLQVKPGITGLAQAAGVRGRHDFDLKSRFDVRYVEDQSFLLDLEILLRTPFVVLQRRRGGEVPGGGTTGGAASGSPRPAAAAAGRC